LNIELLPLDWPQDAEALVQAQTALGYITPPRWDPPQEELAAGACFVCFERGPSGPGRQGDAGWAAAAILRGDLTVATVEARGVAGAGYEPGLLALREGPPLEAALRALPTRPEVVLVDATGRDHPRRAGLALQLGAILDVPTVGITHRPLLAQGEWPHDERGAATPLRLDGAVVGYWLRTKRGVRPLAVHAAWRTDPATAVDVVMRTLRGTRTPQPLRVARRAARAARARPSD
jgi:deoxyribonuclease V